MNNDTTFKNETAHWIAAKWWADKLRSGETPSRNYTRSTAELNPMEAGYVMLSAKAAHYPGYQIDAFEAALATVIAHEMRERNTVFVASDYGAGHLLREACKIVEMPNIDDHLPWKTVVWVEADKVQVREGYGAPVEIVWQRSPENE